MTDKQDSLDAKRDALSIAANILVGADSADNAAGKAVDTAICAAAMVMAVAIAGSPEAIQRKAIDAAVDAFVAATKKLSLNVDREKGLLEGLAAVLALEKLLATAGKMGVAG